MKKPAYFELDRAVNGVSDLELVMEHSGRRKDQSTMWLMAERVLYVTALNAGKDVYEFSVIMAAYQCLKQQYHHPGFVPIPRFLEYTLDT